MRCVRTSDTKRKFRYEAKVGDDIQIISHENNSPTQTSNQSQAHKFIKSVLNGNVIPNELDSNLIRIKNELESHIEEDKSISEEKQSKLQSEKEIEEKYNNLYVNFNYFSIKLSKFYYI